jgi:hypothetical protein
MVMADPRKESEEGLQQTETPQQAPAKDRHKQDGDTDEPEPELTNF